MKNGIVPASEKLMTVREVAEALGYKPDTIQGKAKELFPEIVKNGVATLLTETQVFAIKQNLVPRNLGLKSEVERAVTPLEIEEMTLRVISYHMAEADRLRGELALAKPKVESFEALMRSARTMSITDAAKHFGLHPKLEVFPYLRERGYLTLANLPTQAAIDAGYLALKEVAVCEGIVRPQAVVETRMLDTWRSRVVPQIESWKREVSA